MTFKNKNDGFTLVELSMVLILFGFTTSAVLLGLRTYTQEQRIIRTNEAIELSTTAVSAFKLANGRLPCPADMGDAEGAATYGYEIISGLAVAAANTALDGIEANTDVDLNGDTIDNTYVVGAIPYNTITNSNGIAGIRSIKDTFKGVDFSKNNTIDGYGQKILYAVSRHLCDPNHAESSDPRGVLDIITDRNCVDGGTIYPVSLLPGEGACRQDNKRYAQFVILSHGENARGARSQNGVLMDNCTNLSPGDPVGTEAPTDIFASGYASDVMNCNYAGNKGRFFSGIIREASQQRYYDDKIKFFFEDSSEIWETASGIYQDNGTPLDLTDDFVIPRMKNNNLGNIGIGTEEPQEKLHVDGDIKARDILAEEFCDGESPLASDCLPASILAGEEDQMKCGLDGNAGGFVKSIENNRVICDDPFAGVPFSCPPGEALKTLRSDGTFDCIIP